MKFEDKYPDAEYLKVYEDCLLKADDRLPCRQCGEPTTFVEFNYEARICSEECLKAIDDEVSAACSNSGYPNMMCFGQDLSNCTLGEECPRFEACRSEWLQLDEYEDEFEPGRVNVNMFGLNP